MRQQSIATAQARQGQELRIVNFDEIFTHEQELREQIARRAFDLFEARGRTPGRETEDWLHAESELRRPIRPKLTETQDSLTIRAELPGFNAPHLRVAIEPRRVAISGKKQSSKTEKTTGTTTTEMSSEHIFHLMELPTEVEPTHASARFHGETLELALPKAGRSLRSGLTTRVA